jgi:hypothetical protein
MHMSRSGSCFVFGPGCCASSSSSYFDAGGLPRLVLGIPACRRVSSSSRRLFSRRRTYLSSLSVSWSPRVGVYHCLSRSCRSIVSMDVRRLRRRHRPRRSAVGSPRRPLSAASTNVSICGHRRCRRHHRRQPTLPPGCALEGRRTVTPGAQTAAAEISAVN